VAIAIGTKPSDAHQWASADDAQAHIHREQHEQLNEMREYLERGRALQNISDLEALDT
jgi:hypothetical protein